MYCQDRFGIFDIESKLKYSGDKENQKLEIS
jgi:hypothetical protein